MISIRNPVDYKSFYTDALLLIICLLISLFHKSFFNITVAFIVDYKYSKIFNLSWCFDSHTFIYEFCLFGSIITLLIILITMSFKRREWYVLLVNAVSGSFLIFTSIFFLERKIGGYYYGKTPGKRYITSKFEYCLIVLFLILIPLGI